MHGRTTIVTTSWDDGDFADLKLAEILRSRGIRGTFYLPINYRDRSLDHSEVRTLASEGFEIGAHGFSHTPLCGLPPHVLAEDVRSCKGILEDILGQQVELFCYPCGRYDTNVVRALYEAGYKGARTVRMLKTRLRFDPFEMPTTLQAFPHGPFTYLKNAARARSLESVQSLVVHLPRVRSWIELAKKLFDEVLEKGGVWHLFGHSWEIEQFGLWNDLREVLDYVCRRDGVRYVPNCLLLHPQPIASLPAGDICEGVARGAAAEMKQAAILDVGRAAPPFREQQG
jgi:peptidoglycan/xylan/chitin deacetylase (PgdA/CDA1 family)